MSDATEGGYVILAVILVVGVIFSIKYTVEKLEHSIRNYRKVNKEVGEMFKHEEKLAEYKEKKKKEGVLRTALKPFQDELDDLDEEIAYAEEVKRMEKAKKDKEDYLRLLYAEEDEKDVVYVLKIHPHGRYLSIPRLTVYSTRAEAELNASYASDGRDYYIEELEILRKEDE